MTRLKGWVEMFEHLDRNENKIGGSDTFGKNGESVHLYPRANLLELEGAIAQFCGVDAERVIVFPGAAVAISSILQVVRPRTVATPSLLMAAPTFGAFRAIAETAGYHIVYRPYSSNVALLSEALDSDDTALVCSPHNPYGNLVDDNHHALLNVADRMTRYFLLDEVYADFDLRAYETTDLLNRGQLANAVVIRSLSKYLGLAGLRIGYVISPWGLVEQVRKSRIPFSVSDYSVRCALAALRSSEYLALVENRRVAILETLSSVCATLNQELMPLPTTTRVSAGGNFVWLDSRSDSLSLFDELSRRGITSAHYPMTGVRVTVPWTRSPRILTDTLAQALHAVHFPSAENADESQRVDFKS